MTRCIYCREEMPDLGDPGEDRLRPSKEHIIQSALGGSEALSTMDVCRGCNGELGKTVDAAFINGSIIGMLRQRFKLPGYSGKIPDVVLRLRSVQTNEPGNMVIPPAGTVDVKHSPTVIREPLTNGDERILIAGSREDVARILTGIRAKEARAGRHLIDEAGNSPNSVEEALADAEPELSASYGGQIVVDLAAIRRGLIKVAFGFAHLALGAEWTLSSRADAMRAAARGLATNNEVDGLLRGCDIAIRGPLLADEHQPNHRHLIGLLMTGQSQILVSLFGEALLTTTVALDATREQIERAMVNHALVSLYPGMGDTRWVGLFEFTQRMLRHGGGNGTVPNECPQ